MHPQVYLVFDKVFRTGSLPHFLLRGGAENYH